MILLEISEINVWKHQRFQKSDAIEYWLDFFNAFYNFFLSVWLFDII